MIQVIAESDRNYIVIESDGRFFMDVVCGSSAIFTVSIELTPDEVLQFRSDASSLEALAASIRQETEKFRNRKSAVPSHLPLDPNP